MIPFNNPYWNKNLKKELELEQREELLKIVRPTKKDWELLKRMQSITRATKPKGDK